MTKGRVFAFQENDNIKAKSPEIGDGNCPLAPPKAKCRQLPDSGSDSEQ